LFVTDVVVSTVSIPALLVFAEWEEWLVVVASLWLTSSPYILGFQHSPAMRVSVGAGLLVSYLAALDLWYRHYGPPLWR
jgi:hypothetical protein